MESIQALRERHASTAQNVREILEKSKGEKWTPEMQAKYDEGMASLDDIKGAIDRYQAFVEATADATLKAGLDLAADKLDRDGKTPSARLLAKWIRGGDKALSTQDWTDVRAAMSTTTGSEGGFTVATEVARTLMDALKAFGGMRQVATVIQTAGFGDLNYPTSDGTAEVGEQIAQNVTATAADPTFGVVAVTAWKYSSKIVAVPFELLQDAAIDIEAMVRRRLIQRLGRITNTKFTIGVGTTEPRGVVVAAALGKTGATGQTLTVIFDDLVDLIHSVDPAYRELGNSRWMMADSSLKVIRKLKDTAGRPIFLPGYDGLGRAMPDTVLGYPVQINQDVPVMAANAKSILFGDFSFYVVRDVMAAQLFRFEDSAYAKLGQVGFLMWMRSGGNYTDVGGGVKHYANSAT